MPRSGSNVIDTEMYINMSLFEKSDVHLMQYGGQGPINNILRIIDRNVRE
jgi:hypothetical protein